MRLLMLITAVVIAGLMGVRFGEVGIVNILTDWRVFVSAAASYLIWSVVGAIVCGFKEQKPTEPNDESASSSQNDGNGGN